MTNFHQQFLNNFNKISMCLLQILSKTKSIKHYPQTSKQSGEIFKQTLSKTIFKGKMVFIIVRTNGIYNASICNNANFNWKSLKSQKMQATNTFSYFSLPRRDLNHQPSDRLNSNPS
jgi:hypothetical protein